MLLINVESKREQAQMMDIFFNKFQNEKAQYTEYLSARQHIYVLKQLLISIIFVIGIIILIVYWNR